MDASSTSKGPGAVVASPSIRILGPYGRPAWNSRPPTHSTSIAAACGTVADCDFDIRFNPTPLRPCPMPSTILERLLSLVALDLEVTVAPSPARGLTSRSVVRRGTCQYHLLGTAQGGIADVERSRVSC